jgi:hypothetical protein
MTNGRFCESAMPTSEQSIQSIHVLVLFVGAAYICGTTAIDNFSNKRIKFGNRNSPAHAGSCDG